MYYNNIGITVVCFLLFTNSAYSQSVQDLENKQLVNNNLGAVSTMTDLGVFIGALNPNLPDSSDATLLPSLLANPSSNGFRRLELIDAQKEQVEELLNRYLKDSNRLKRAFDGDNLAKKLKDLGAKFETDLNQILLPFQVKALAAQKIRQYGYVGLVLKEIQLTQRQKAQIQAEAERFASDAARKLKELKEESIARINSHLTSEQRSEIEKQYGDEISEQQNRILIQLIIDQYRAASKDGGD